MPDIDPNPKKRGKGAGFWIVVVVLTLVALYPLSIGPVSGMVMESDTPMSTAEAFNSFYGPILRLAARHETGRIALSWYIDQFASPEIWRFISITEDIQSPTYGH